MKSTFGDAFQTHPNGPRVVALEVARGYRDAAAETRSVTLSRYVACPTCARRGCARCDRAGWTIDVVTATVTVPFGATPGTRLPVEGLADVVVEIVEPGARAIELRAANDDYDSKIHTAWAMDRAAGRRGVRQFYVGSVVVVAGLLLWAMASGLMKPGTGEPCKADNDCRSGSCMRIMTMQQDGHPRLDAQVCTELCANDLGCPDRFRCGDPRRAPSRFDDPRRGPYVLGAPDGKVCLPPR